MALDTDVDALLLAPMPSPTPAEAVDDDVNDATPVPAADGSVADATQFAGGNLGGSSTGLIDLDRFDAHVEALLA